jgi:parvulin-like peptidyl-prolyl isomerase
VVVAAAVAVVLSGCQSRLGAAALVGDQRISDDQLQTLVQDALASPGVRDALPRSSYKGDLGAYRRTVLNLEVELALADAAARRLGITVNDAKINERYRFYEQQSGSPAQFGADLASRDALSPGLFRELLRAQVIESEIGYRVGNVQRPSEAELSRLYEQYAAANTNATLSLVQVPDEAAASDAVARAQRDPAALEAIAKQYADLQQTSTGPQPYVLSRLPEDLTKKLATLKSGDVFSYTLTASGNRVFYVIRFGGIHRPTLAASRPQLESQSIQAAARAGRGYLGTVAKQIGVQVNPRYGAWNGDKLTIVDFVNPAVRPTPPPVSPGSPGAPAPSGSVPGGTEPSTGGTG